MNYTVAEDTVVSRCRFYREVCALPAVIDPVHAHQIVVEAHEVWAVVMANQLGMMVKMRLSQQFRRSGPIMTHPRSGRWTFLVAPSELPADHGLEARLLRAAVSVVRGGNVVALPSPGFGGCFREWIDAPVGAFRLSAGQVIEAALAGFEGAVQHV